MRLARGGLRRLGLDLRRIDTDLPLVPTWFQGFDPATAPCRDDVHDGLTFHYVAPSMANRAHTPARLGYRRARRGDDQRLKYLVYYLDVRDLRVLELGPFEAHHTIVLDKLGAREIVLLEGREENLAKCRWVCQRYGIDGARSFLCNIEDVYEGRVPMPVEGGFDLVFNVGWLYHVPDPGRALTWCRSIGSRLFLGTHYVEPAARALYRSPDETYEFLGHSYRAKRVSDGDLSDPLAGLSSYSTWLYEPDLVRLLKQAGYRRVDVLGRDLQAGLPHITILASGDDPEPSA